MNDRITLVAVVFLGLLGIGSLAGIILLELAGEQIPPALAGIAGATAGGLLALLPSSRKRDNDPPSLPK